jgi:lactoylglutathione lyase
LLISKLSFILNFVGLISEFLITKKGGRTMKLGAFSVSLNVKDIQLSKTFYENLGFQVFGGDDNQNWLIMKNENCVIGLFQGMFEKNLLTFNPGWNQNAENLESFTDVRELQKQLKEKGIKILTEADASSEGPGYFTIEDPDGNPILIDQHR